MKQTFRIRFGVSRCDNRKSKIQNLKWAGFLAILVLLVGCAGMVEAQQPGRVYRIGYLFSGLLPPKEFLEALRHFGYVEGKNIAVEFGCGRKRGAT